MWEAGPWRGGIQEAGFHHLRKGSRRLRHMSMQVKAKHKTHWILSYLPILQWLPRYNWGQWLTPDIIAGLTTWGVVIPTVIACASLAGMPPQTGIYAILASLVAYAIFG